MRSFYPGPSCGVCQFNTSVSLVGRNVWLEGLEQRLRAPSSSRSKKCSVNLDQGFYISWTMIVCLYFCMDIILLRAAA